MDWEAGKDERKYEVTPPEGIGVDTSRFNKTTLFLLNNHRTETLLAEGSAAASGGRKVGSSYGFPRRRTSSSALFGQPWAALGRERFER